jgi:hypothetical protein
MNISKQKLLWNSYLHCENEISFLLPKPTAVIILLFSYSVLLDDGQFWLKHVVLNIKWRQYKILDVTASFFYYNLPTTNLKAGISISLKWPFLKRNMNSAFDSISGAQSSHEWKLLYFHIRMHKIQYCIQNYSNKAFCISYIYLAVAVLYATSIQYARPHALTFSAIMQY